MKRGSFLVAFGFLILAVSIGWWQLTRPQAEVGDAASIEQALTTTTTTTAVPTPDPVTPPRPEASPPPTPPPTTPNMVG